MCSSAFKIIKSSLMSFVFLIGNSEDIKNAPGKKRRATESENVSHSAQVMLLVLVVALFFFPFLVRP